MLLFYRSAQTPEPRN